MWRMIGKIGYLTRYKITSSKLLIWYAQCSIFRIKKWVHKRFKEGPFGWKSEVLVASCRVKSDCRVTSQPLSPEGTFTKLNYSLFVSQIFTEWFKNRSWKKIPHCIIFMSLIKAKFLKFYFFFFQGCSG